MLFANRHEADPDQSVHLIREFSVLICPDDKLVFSSISVLWFISCFLSYTSLAVPFLFFFEGWHKITCKG